MGNKNPKNQFKKGAPPGPGRPRLPDDLKELKELTKIALEKSVHKYTLMSIEELDKVSKDPNTIAIDRLILSILKQGIIKGDQQRATFLYDRIVGKVKENVTIEGGIKVTIEDYSKDK